MTAFVDDTVRARASALGAVVLDKPFKMVELRAAARRLFETSASGDTP
jgi:DNA-binding response OmpR family regulator